MTLDQSGVASEDYLASLVRRLDILERKVVGKLGVKEDQPPLKTTLDVSWDIILMCVCVCARASRGGHLYAYCADTCDRDQNLVLDCLIS